MNIINYKEEWKERWDEFVKESNNGTLFHLQKFFDYHTPGKFSFNHLIFLEDNKIVAILPGSMIGNKFESPIGASYGSIVTKDIKFDKALEIVSTLIEYGKANGINEFELTAPPVVYEDKPNQNLDFAMLWLGFKYSLHYISSAIKLDKDVDIISRFQPSVRGNIRRSFRNPDIRVEINDRYDHFYPILLNNKAKHNVKPTHTLDELLKLKELLPEHLKLFMIYYKDIPIGGSLMFFVNKTCALCFYNMLDYKYAKLKPIHRIMYEVVKYSTENGYSYVDIGVSQDTAAENPMTPSMSLIAHKEGFDAKTVMRNTLSIKL
jgi:hypothetical protein